MIQSSLFMGMSRSAASAARIAMSATGRTLGGVLAGTLVSFAAHAANCAAPPVSGKVYNIVNEGSGLYLDVAKRSKDDGADVTQYRPTNGTNQQWTLTKVGNDEWTLRAVHSQKALDLVNWRTDAGAPFKQWATSQNANQLFFLREAIGGAVNIVSRHSWQFVTVDASDAKSGVYQDYDNESAGQRWFLNPVDGSCDTPPPVNTGSAGCSGAPQFADGRYTLVSDGQTREYWVDVPANYKPGVPLPLVVGLHWRWGQATDVYGAGGNNFFGLKPLYGDAAIFVAPNGLDKGWANPGDRDMRFIRTMVDQLKRGMCVDNTRVFATGFSYGGMMSNAIGCQAGDVFRAIAPISGALVSGCADSKNTVAALFIHTANDEVVPPQWGAEARDKFLAKNQCSKTTRSIGTNGCVEYQGCSTGHPVVWCETPQGGHWPPAFSTGEIKTFFDRF